MKTVTIKNITLGTGKPKICLPIIGTTLSEIATQAASIMEHPVDIIEWRADFYEQILDNASVTEAIHTIRQIIGETPLLFTIRTANEGGELSIDFSNYSAILKTVAPNSDIDAIDVEIHIAEQKDVTALIDALKENAVVIASNHDFDKTPDTEEIVIRLKYMEICGSDVCKMAVMPKTEEDVLTLLTATNAAHKTVGRPIITMSMGPLGIISRICGETFGSSLTFGCVGKASAPGQIAANDLNSILDILHKNI